MTIKMEKKIVERDGKEIEVFEVTRDEFLEIVDEVLDSVIRGLVIGSKDEAMIVKSEDFKKGYTLAVSHVRAIKNVVKTTFDTENEINQMGLFK